MNSKNILASFWSTSLIAAAASASTTLYGISSIGTTDTFCQINTATGAATALFSFTNSGGLGTNYLAYNPTNNKFVTAHFLSSNSCQLIEIDAVAQTATVMANQIPASFFEGLEYSAALGGLVVSYGANSLTGQLALLNNSYNLIANNSATGLADGDCLFTDGSGALNVLDANNPTGGFQRNIILNPFGAIGLSGVAANTFSISGDIDLAWKGDESRLFLTRLTSLATVGAGNAITNVGSFGAGSDGTPFFMTGIAAIPAPGAAAILGLGGMMSARRRRIGR